MYNSQPVDDLLKSFDNFVRQVGGYWTAFISNNYVVTAAAIDFFVKFGSEAFRQHAQLWLHNEYMRRLREQNQARLPA
jgi:hypothetical protein